MPRPTEAAGALECPLCAAPVGPNSSHCDYCSAELLVKACPRCFARVFHGAKHCKNCGAEVDVPARIGLDGHATVRHCPRCETSPALEAQLVGDVLLDTCPECLGLWLDAAALERIVRERRQATASAILGLPSDRLAAPPVARGQRMYIKCPDCGNVMNRVNFARTSGVIIDSCKNHGTWFDADELPRVVELVMAGGLEESERRHIEDLRQRAKDETDRARFAATASSEVWLRDYPSYSHSAFAGLLSAIGHLLWGTRE
ncbi:MAG TPA: zf-TFIIB domain-containing protein [Kofleriaceae bacterium]|nr:zf-TFIIB domain-containing protein [Kofleriaceae bacterium]